MKARQPVRCRTTGLWRARYEADGKIREAGPFTRKRDAQTAILEAMGDATDPGEAYELFGESQQAPYREGWSP